MDCTLPVDREVNLTVLCAMATEPVDTQMEPGSFAKTARLPSARTGVSDRVAAREPDQPDPGCPAWGVEGSEFEACSGSCAVARRRTRQQPR